MFVIINLSSTQNFVDMFKNRKPNIKFHRPTPFVETVVQKNESTGGTDILLSEMPVVKSIPLPEQYKLSALLDAGVPLSQVSLDITPDSELDNIVNHVVTDKQEDNE